MVVFWFAFEPGRHFVSLCLALSVAVCADTHGMCAVYLSLSRRPLSSSGSLMFWALQRHSFWCLYYFLFLLLGVVVFGPLAVAESGLLELEALVEGQATLSLETLVVNMRDCCVNSVWFSSVQPAQTHCIACAHFPLLVSVSACAEDANLDAAGSLLCFVKPTAAVERMS